MKMNPIPSGKIKSFIISITLLLILIASLHLFIVYKANILLPGLVQNLSHGKYELKVKNLKFSYWNASIDLKEVQLLPAVENLEEEFHVQAISIHLRIHSLFSLITGRNIMVRELVISGPDVEVKRNAKVTKVIKRSELHLLIGTLQQSAIHFLQALQVDRSSITGGSFRYFPIPESKNHYNIKNIDIRLTDVHVKESDQDLTGKIKISVLDPGLILPDSLKHIQLDKFIWDSEKDIVEVGKFVISQKGKKNLSDSAKVELDALIIKKLYWKEWIQTGIVHVDSLMAENGKMYFSISGTHTKRKLRDSVDLKRMKVWDVIGNLKIGYFSARKINAAIINNQADWERDNTILGDSLVVRKLFISPRLKIPLMLEDLAIGVRSFEDKGKGKKIHTSFTGLRLRGDTLSLNNYQAKTTAKSKLGEGTMLNIPVVTMIGISVKDIMEDKAQIHEIWMQSPYFKFKGDPLISGPVGPIVPSNIFDELKSYVDVQKVYITNGSLDFMNKSDGKLILQLRNCKVTVLAKKLLSAFGMSEALNSITNSSIGFVQYKNGLREMNLGQLNFDYGSGKFNIGNTDIHFADMGLTANVKGIQLRFANGFDLSAPLKNGHLRYFKLDSGFIMLKQKEKNENENILTAKNFLFDSIDVHHLKLQLAKSKWNLDAKIFHFNSSNFSVLPDIASWSMLNTSIGGFHYVSDNLDILINRAELDPLGKSLFRESSVFSESDNFSVKASLPVGITGTRFSDTKFKQMGLEFLALTKPTIEVFIENKIDSLQEIKNLRKIFYLNELIADDPRLFVTVKNKNETVSFGTSGEKIRGKGLSVLGNRKISGFSMDDLSASFGTSEVESSSRNIFRTGFIDFNIHEIRKNFHDPLQASIRKFNVGSFKLNRIRGADT
ncbi:MAG: hypothetical protein ACO29O_03155, partial [Chitinophagaceae bacterium]